LVISRQDTFLLAPVFIAFSSLVFTVGVGPFSIALNLTLAGVMALGHFTPLEWSVNTFEDISAASLAFLFLVSEVVAFAFN
jgi:hypothetical protein